MDVMKTALLGIFMGFIYFPTYTHGRPQLLSSTSNVELSGEVCPGYIILTCSKNTTERIFVWYTNDIELARFDEEDVTPFTIKTRPDLFNATVGLTSVIEVNGYYLFDNFTLTARVSDFLPLQGQNLTCGTLLDRSEPFRANTFSIYEGSLVPPNITVVPQYDDELYLDEIMVSLNLSVSECSNINYLFELVLYRDNMTSIVESKTIECNEGRNCSTNFKVNRNNASYNIVIARNDVAGGSFYTSDSLDGVISNSSLKPSLQVVYSNCSARCESNMIGDCELRFHTIDDGIVSEISRISINSTILFLSQREANTIFYYIATFFINGTTFKLQGNFTVKENSVESRDDTFVLAIGWIALIAGIILNVFGCIKTGIYRKYFLRTGKMIIMGFQLISTISLATAALLFISYYTTYREDTCGTKLYNYSIAISAVVISLVYCACSACVTGAIYIWPNIDMFDNAKSPRDSRRLKFGRTIYYFSNNTRCLDCKKYLWQWDLCQSCSKCFCKGCIGNSEAFIFRNMKMGKVCPSCDLKYCEENKKIMEADSVAELAKLQNTVTDGECCVCNNLKQNDYKCSSCSQNICKKHFKKLPKRVSKEFSIDEGNYCYFCYDIYLRKYDCKYRTQTTTSL